MTEPRHRPDQSMTLLREVVERPLDPGYAEAARRRAAGTASRMTWWRQLLVVVLAAVLGLGGVWAARSLRTPAPGASEARTLLIEQIEAGTTRGEELRAERAALVGQIDDLQTERLGETDSEFLDYVRLLAVNAGGMRVSGPGLVVTLDDSREAQAGEEGSELGRVQDVDLQVVTNALWSAGAEAIAINGHRLSTLSAIRSAGPAVLVDLVPLARPYVVEAIGDPEGMQAHLARSTGGAHLATLRDSFGISADIERVEELVLPGTASRTLRHAEPMTSELPELDVMLDQSEDTSTAAGSAAAGEES